MVNSVGYEPGDPIVVYCVDVLMIPYNVVALGRSTTTIVH